METEKTLTQLDLIETTVTDAIVDIDSMAAQHFHNLQTLDSSVDLIDILRVI